MVVYCCAYACNEKFVKGGAITFHHFPKDPERRRLWELHVRRENFKATDHTKICSKHFTDECFDTTKFGATWLKTNAVPTIFNFPQHLQKLSCTRNPPQKHLKSSESTSVDCQNEGFSDDQPQRKKRLHYLGDFDVSDVTSSTNAQKMLDIFQAQVSNLKQTIKNLSRKNNRLQKRIASFNEILNELQSRRLITDEATLILKRVSSNMAESCSKKQRRICIDSNKESKNEIVSKENIETEPYFTTVEEDIKNPLTLKRLQAIPCGNYAAEKCFEWFIHPISPREFFDESFEKKPFYIKRDNSCYYKGLFSGKDFDKIMRENLLEYTKNIDVVSYTDGERVTLNPEGRAYAPVVWDFYQQGCSIRMRNPQAYSNKLWQLCSLLQEYFGSFVGVNMYLTPPGSQGFAPHFDDIEAFVLQLEGSKHWRVYSPRSQKETLPSYSSGNFTQDEIGNPVCELELKPGNLLYFPRGFIHQARTPEDTHSLHITVSTYQKNTWGHLLELALPRALSKAVENEVELRESLPKDYLNYVGEVNTDSDCPERLRFIEKVTSLAQRVIKHLPVDEAVDQHAKEFIHSSMPPFLTEREKECSIHGGGEYWDDGQVKGIIELQPDSKIRFIRKRIVRMVIEENSAHIYHAIENSKDYKEFDMKFVECDLGAVPAFQFLLQAHPKFIPIEELPLETLEDKINFASDLYANGFLMTEEPLENIEE